MRSYSTLVLILFCVSSMYSQFLENFDDGNLNSDPVWIGDTSFFIVNSQLELQSAGPAQSAIIKINTDSERLINTEWNFSSRLDFSPSSSNYPMFFLAADHFVPDSISKAYYIKMGGESGNDDGIDLYKFAFGNNYKIIDGLDGYCGGDSSIIEVLIKRDFYGNWKLYADSGSGNMDFQGEIFDTLNFIPRSCGIQFKHSSTRRDKFFIDNIKIQNSSFEIVEIIAINKQSLKLSFSSIPDSTHLFNPHNYLINKGIGPPLSVISDNNSHRQIELNFDFDIPPDDYVLRVSNLEDTEGNYLEDSLLDFKMLYKPEYKDIIINEIMYDPEPEVGLPIAEYLELYNACPFDFQMSDLILEDIGGTTGFGDYILKSGEYLILCEQSDTSLFKSYGNVFFPNNWLSLNNSGDHISLINANGLIDQIEYDPGFYKDPIKAVGGWSLEKIRHKKKCEDANNWAASIDPRGGSPGIENSISDNSNDFEGPRLDSVSKLNALGITLFFNDRLDLIQNLNSEIHLNDQDQVIINSIIGNQMRLIFKRALDSGKVYSLNIDTIWNCEGNAGINIQTQIGIGRDPEMFDLVFTEIMPDPDPARKLPKTEYIEIYNRTNDIINLSELRIIDENDTSECSEKNLFPGKYLLLTSKSKKDSFSVNLNIGYLNPWPGLPNSGSQLKLYSKNKLIHILDYDISWIRDELKQDGGWSIESIDPNNFCEEINNWDASENLNGGTPGERNSQYFNNPDYNKPTILEHFFQNDSTLMLQFNEKILAVNYESWSISAEPNKIQNLDFHQSISRFIGLEFNQPFLSGNTYSIEISGVSDCAYNYLNDISYELIIPELPKDNEILINELLFDPNSGGSEFIEIYNKLSKPINLEKCVIRTIDEEGNTINQMEIEKPQIFRANDYLVFTKDSSKILDFYPRARSNAIIENSKLPSFDNNKGRIQILDSLGEVLDDFVYEDDMHNLLLEDKKGVSLERISLNSNALQIDNWTSASKNSGFATPGYENSQFLKDGSIIEEIEVDPPIISPDADGFNDIMRISIKNSDPSLSALIEIYNINGIRIREIASNSNLGSRNEFFWNGFDDQGIKAKIGNYILYVELYNSKGLSKRVKKVISVGRRF